MTFSAPTMFLVRAVMMSDHPISEIMAVLSTLLSTVIMALLAIALSIADQFVDACPAIEHQLPVLASAASANDVRRIPEKSYPEEIQGNFLQ